MIQIFAHWSFPKKTESIHLTDLYMNLHSTYNCNSPKVETTQISIGRWIYLWYKHPMKHHPPYKEKNIDILNSVSKRMQTKIRVYTIQVHLSYKFKLKYNDKKYLYGFLEAEEMGRYKKNTRYLGNNCDNDFI